MTQVIVYKDQETKNVCVIHPAKKFLKYSLLGNKTDVFTITNNLTGDEFLFVVKKDLSKVKADDAPCKAIEYVKDTSNDKEYKKWSKFPQKIVDALNGAINNEAVSIEEIAKKDVPDGVPYRITESSNLPKDRTFREAWTDDNPTETVDVYMEAAREVHMKRIRDVRNSELEELDKRKYGSEYDEKRQQLRDLPKSLDLSVAKTPEELQELWPSELEK